MKSQFLRRPSLIRMWSDSRPPARVAFISERNARISFKFWLWLPLWHTVSIFVFYFKKNKIIFLQIVFVFVNMRPYGSKNFKTLLLQIAAESVQSFPEFIS